MKNASFKTRTVELLHSDAEYQYKNVEGQCVFLFLLRVLVDSLCSLNVPTTTCLFFTSGNTVRLGFDE